MKRAIKNIGLVAATLAAGVLVTSTANAAFSGWYQIGAQGPINTPGVVAPIPPVTGNWTYNKFGTGMTANNNTGFALLVGPNSQIQLSGVANGIAASGYVDFYIPLAVGDSGFSFTYTGASDGNIHTSIGWFSGANYGSITRHLLANGGNTSALVLANPGDVMGFYVSGDGQTTGANITIADFNPVPEPATMLLNGVILLAGGAVGWVYRRRTAKA